MKHPTPNHGEVIIYNNHTSGAIWSVKDMLDGKEPNYSPVKWKRSKKHGLIWQFKGTQGGLWWQTCNEDPLVAELMAVQFKLKQNEAK